MALWLQEDTTPRERHPRAPGFPSDEISLNRMIRFQHGFRFCQSEAGLTSFRSGG